MHHQQLKSNDKQADIQSDSSGTIVTYDLQSWQAEAAFKAQEELRKNLIESQLEQLPQRYKSASFDNYEILIDKQKIALNRARKFADSLLNKQNVSGIFCGTPGTGKTHLSVAVFRNFVQAGKRARWMPIYKVIDEIRTAYKPWCTDTKSSIIDRLAKLDLLIIDDVGKTTAGEAEQTELFELFNERYNAEKPTLITTNLNDAGICDYLGETVHSRLLDNNGITIVCDWDDYRASTRTLSK